MKKIAIIDDNKFVHYAINAVLQKYDTTRGRVVSFYSLEDALPSLANCDTLILEPNGKCYNVMQSFNLLINNSRVRHMNLILMTGLPSEFSLTLFGNCPISEIISKDSSIEFFFERLTNQLIGSECVDRVNERAEFRYRLTSAEYRVLNDIFLGHTQYQIAKKTQRSIKTISQHKMNALGKLGVKSLQELIFSLSEVK